MARCIALNGDEVDSKLRTFIGNTLRVCDEAVVLPSASRSSESGAMKNVVVHLNGENDGLSHEVFSSNWFAGVSMIRVPNEKAELLLGHEAKRLVSLKALVAAVPSEMQDSDVQVGPELDGDELNRDTKPWTYGFDGPGCCVGLYSALQSRPPATQNAGMARQFREYYLVAKAGAGVAAQTFHARLSASLGAGQSLETALGEEGTPGARALRRVASASRRNRERILLAAAQALGFHTIDTVGDSCAPPVKPHRVAVPTIEACYNSIFRLDDQGAAGRVIYQYAAGCVDAAVSQGCITSSNLADGFVAFVTSTGEPRINLRNQAYSCVPFSTPRLMNNRDAVLAAVEAHKKVRLDGRQNYAHPDAAWIRTRFGWSAKEISANVDLEPPALWGSHASEDFLAEWARELGLSRASPIRLQPELVAISAVEPSRLRVAAKEVAKAARRS